MTRSRALVGVLVLLGAWWTSSCSPGGFADSAEIASVRILASSADKPYAKPGETVTVQILAYDGRTQKPAPMNIYWLPFVCENPPDDAYFACFKQLVGQGPAGGDAGAASPLDAGAGTSAGPGVLKPGVDLSPFLPSGPTYRFKMPADAVTSHPVVAGTRVPYGLAILFNFACAGHLELIAPDPSNDNPQQVPIGCFDERHHQLGPTDFVFGFTRVYAYDEITNTNPTICGVDVQGATLGSADCSRASLSFATTNRFSTPRCTADRRANCKYVKIGPIVPADQQEANPEDIDANGQMRREEIWVDFYAGFTHTVPGQGVSQSFTQFSDDARLLYDPGRGSVGKPDDTNTKFLPPGDPGDGFIWIVVHDNRGGASWVTVPVHACGDGDAQCAGAATH